MLLTLVIVMMVLWLFDITAFSVAQDWRQFIDRRAHNRGQASRV
jgi:hypothetical protein